MSTIVNEDGVKSFGVDALHYGISGSVFIKPSDVRRVKEEPAFFEELMKEKSRQLRESFREVFSDQGILL